MSLIEPFKAIDYKLLIILNQKISNSLFDLIMPIITNEDYWEIPDSLSNHLSSIFWSNYLSFIF